MYHKDHFKKSYLQILQPEMKWSYMHTGEKVCVMDRIQVKKLSLTMNLLSTTSACSAAQTLRLPAK